MYLHFRSSNASDYFKRRDLPCPPNLKMARYGSTYRLAHINMCLDMRAIFRAAGPSPEGTSAEIFYQLSGAQQLDELLRDDPYVVGGIWASWSIRRLVDFVEPLSPIPVCLDGTRRVTAVELSAKDPRAATVALQRLRDAQTLAVGGVTEDEVAIAWMRTVDVEEAVHLLQVSGVEAAARPSTHSMIWVL